jgi:hypothetical protein
MKLKMSNDKLLSVYGILRDKYVVGSYDKRFMFSVQRAISSLEPIVKDLVKASESSVDGFVDYEKERKDLLLRYCEYGEDGKFVRFLDSYGDGVECNRLVGELVGRYKDVLEKREVEIGEYNSLLLEEVEVDIYPCSFVSLPDGFDFLNLRCLVKESDEEIEGML